MNTGGRRAARQVRNIEFGLLAGGIVLLGLTMSMAGRFGYGLGHDELGRWGNAAFYMVADALGAVLMSVIGVLFAWRHFAVGILTTFAMVVCVVFSMNSIFGFQSANRTAVTTNHETVQKHNEKRLDWLRGQVIDKGLAKDRQAFLHEEREQFKSMQGVTIDPDAQATELAKLLGIGKGDAQSRLNMISAAFILFLQFVCLSLRSFLRHRVEPAVSAWTTANDRQLSTPTSDNLANPEVFTKAAARSDLERLLATGFSLEKYGAYSTLARRWGWKVNTTSRWVRAQEDFNAPAPPKRNRKVEHVNSNGRAHPA